MGKVVVIGALSYDCWAVVPDFPKPGQTLAVADVTFRLGGQGGNHAVAAALQGAEVSLIGCVGDDSAGDAYCQFLEHRGVATEGVITRAGWATGTGMVMLRERDGEHAAVAAACANATLDPTEVAAQRTLIARSRICLAQLDFPPESLFTGLELARLMGSAVCLHARPWAGEFRWGSVDLDFVIVGPDEVKALLGRYAYSLRDDEWIQPLLVERRIETLLMHSGFGAVWVFRQGQAPVEYAAPVLPEAVDTGGAMDAFAGAFAARWAEDRQLGAALEAALKVCVQVISTRGAQESFPTREATENWRP